MIPDSRLVEGIVKVFVKTGPEYDAYRETHRIEIDIKQAGNHKWKCSIFGSRIFFFALPMKLLLYCSNTSLLIPTGFRRSPRILDGNSVEVVGPFPLFGKALHFNILNIASMMRIKIECCLTREEARDFEDVRFMMTSHGEQVRAAIERGVINEDELYEVLSHEKMGDEATRARLRNMVT